jgi:hypothetical protein
VQTQLWKRSKRSTGQLAASVGFRLDANSYPRGSWQWLVCKENALGGLVSNVKRRRVSPFDDRTRWQLARGGMTGGDRMFTHGYAPHYAHHFRRFLSRPSVTVVEVGILKGSGLGIWCELFSGGRVVGLDIDLSHVNENMENLRSLGAFAHLSPELYEFDQLDPDSDLLNRIFGGRKIDIVIDDGLHSRDSILRTYEALEPFQSSESLYIIEDNASIAEDLRTVSQHRIFDYGELTVIDREATG